MCVMFQNPGISSTEPITWNPDCVLGVCKNCPALQLEVTEAIKSKVIKFSPWESRKVPVTKTNKQNVTTTQMKYVFTLYPYMISMNDAIKKLIKLLPDLKLHTATAHRQWNAHEVHRNNMDPHSVITIED